ncbi:TlpA family protein disulfide reductase [Fulvivirga sedimenti]|uniref:TlpA family protein disulfide reductase n=1 Tax=Fulvivirga sedimenti TaxID=2879465 RepID=A0A9X1HUL2_9BACT|nr:TlpA family protein disulfide reductase [Fulvivirga sedimenti]MCA6078583.1 TlpA family protein disulfide reductase [Fulvivirga sedimenti]
MKYLFPLVIVMLLSSLPDLMAQKEARIVSFEEFEQRMNSSVKDITVINFWATWCAPCIKELPHFEEAFSQHKERMDLLLINLDFVEKIGKVNEFIVKKELTGDVLLLDEIDYNTWIDKVDTSWSGAIPATLLINRISGERKFIEGEISASELDTILEDFLQ